MHGKNFESSYQYCPPEMIDTDTTFGTRAGVWRKDVEASHGMLPLQRNLGSNNYSKDAITVRENFRDFFSEGHGQVPWQMEYVTSVQNNFDRRHTE